MSYVIDQILESDHKEMLFDLIHIESTYKTFINAVKSIADNTTDKKASESLIYAIKFVDKDSGGPKDLENIRKKYL